MKNAPEAARFLLPSGMRLLPIETVSVVEAKDSLWHFAEAIAQCVRRQGAIVDALEPDFDWYAPYERRVIRDGP